jgi:acetate kinase
MPRVLIVNSGSSSIKYQLIDPDGPQRLAHGQVERIGHADAGLHHTMRCEDRWREHDEVRAIADHDEGLAAVVDALHADGLDRHLTAIGHRVVHGGDRFREPTVIDDAVTDGIRALIPLAPLHNPPNLAGIEVARRLWPQVPQVAVFDTAFHAALPPVAYRYAVPEHWYTGHGVRRYGMHGTSHGYVARRAAEVLGRPLDDLRLITAHLGNGASMAAVAGGRSIDTSMGLSPLEGLVMGTRSGDLDPAIIFHVGREAGLSSLAIERELNRESGLRGLCGDNDLRVVEQRAADGDARAELALAVFCYRIRKYVGAYAVALGGLDALVFTAGIGEHSPTVRARVCDGLGLLGVALDDRANTASTTVVSGADSAVAVLVVPTDEELEIATQTLAAIAA